LRDLRGGDTFRINKVTLGGEIGKRLVDMGLTNGVEGVILRCALLGDPMEIRIRDYNVSLRRSEAAGVEVELRDSFPWRGHRSRMARGWAMGRHGRHAMGRGMRRDAGFENADIDGYSPFQRGGGGDGSGPDDRYNPFDLGGDTSRRASGWRGRGFGYDTWNSGRGEQGSGGGPRSADSETRNPEGQDAADTGESQ
jgi:ferrous iron transport protein A